MIKYEMKYMYDFGSGTCLWSLNEKAISTFDYPVDIDKLPISQELKDFLFYLIEYHDKALNWADPASDLLWSEEECAAFIDDAMIGFDRLSHELKDDFIIHLAQLI